MIFFVISIAVVCFFLWRLYVSYKKDLAAKTKEYNVGVGTITVITDDDKTYVVKQKGYVVTDDWGVWPVYACDLVTDWFAGTHGQLLVEDGRVKTYIHKSKIKTSSVTYEDFYEKSKQ
jgi:hypothetical protein